MWSWNVTFSFYLLPINSKDETQVVLAIVLFTIKLTKALLRNLNFKFWASCNKVVVLESAAGTRKKNRLITGVFLPEGT